MVFESKNIPESWEKEYLFKESILCLLSDDGSIFLLNYIKRSGIGSAFIDSFKKAWFLDTNDRRCKIRCIWEAKRLGATSDMIKGLMREWAVEEKDLEDFGDEIHGFQCDKCKYCSTLDSFGAYSCLVPENTADLWVQCRPRRDNMPKFPLLFYPEEMLGVCSHFEPSSQ